MSRRRGFTLLEVLISLVILSVGVIAVLQLFPHALRQVRAAAERTQAAELAESRFALLRAAGVGDGLSGWLQDIRAIEGDLKSWDTISNVYTASALYQGVKATIERIAGSGDIYRVTLSIVMSDGRSEKFVTYIAKQ